MTRVRITRRWNSNRGVYRHRERNNNWDYYQPDFVTGTDRCEDDDYGVNASYLYITHQQSYGGIVSQPFDPEGMGNSQENYSCSFIQLQDQGLYFHNQVSLLPIGQAATKGAALSNPSRPTVDLPVFIAELGDIPKLFKLEGENLLRKGANANLMYHFGWAPLISDSLKLLMFVDYVNKRIKRLERLKKRGLRSTIEVDSAQSTSSGIITNIHANAPWPNVPYTRQTKATCRVFCRWEPDARHPIPDDSSSMRLLALRAVLGLEINPAAAWELIPFSWLVDWCGSVGDYLSTYRNVVPSVLADCLVMYETVSQFKTSSASTTQYRNNVSVSPIEATSITKTRTRQFPTLDASLPFLDARQMSILGSIGVTRRLNVARR